MKTIAYSLLISATLAFSVQAAPTLQFEEDFEGGATDWVDVDRDPVTHYATGGQDGGAYISVTEDIDTTGGGNFGGYTLFRCAVLAGPPAENCSSGGFVGNWYFTTGTQILRFWFRHNSAKSGGLQGIVRVAIPGNQAGGPAVFAAVPANTWTQLSVAIDPQYPAWDPSWGALLADAVKIFRNVGRLQPGFYVDPGDPAYTESSVIFDIDDVQILGSPSVTAVVDAITSGGQQGHGHPHRTIHPHHDGGPDAIDDLDDTVRLMVFGASKGAGDPEDLDTDDIITSSVRIGRLGGTNISGEEIYNLDHDSDGLDDVEFAALTGDAFARAERSRGSCQASWAWPDKVEFRGELTTGEVVAGEDTVISVNCNAQCHN